MATESDAYFLRRDRARMCERGYDYLDGPQWEIDEIKGKGLHRLQHSFNRATSSQVN